MMFVAALSCVYLHLIDHEKEKSTKSYSSYYTTTGLTSFWRGPASVKAPLGIVTAMELGFTAMFIALLVWSLANYLHVGFYNMHTKPVAGMKEYVHVLIKELLQLLVGIYLYITSIKTK